MIYLNITPEQYSNIPPPYTDNDAKIVYATPPPPSQYHRQRLQLPVCLPQVTGGYDSPFARGYNPQLAASGIDQDEFLKFLDALNIAMAASPPLRVIDTAGFVIGFVPYHWAIAAGVVMQAGAQTAMRYIQKTLTDRLLKRVNSTYFEPRGLKVRLMKTRAMRRFVGIEQGGAEPSKAMKFAKNFGHGLENVAYRLPIPIVGRIVSALNPQSNVDPNSTSTVTERRMEALKGYIAPMSLDVPPVRMPDGLMDKASELAIKLRVWQSNRANTKAMRDRRMLAISEGRIQPGSQLDYSQPGSSGVVDQFLDLRNNRRSGRRGRRQDRKLRGNVAKADRLEKNTTNDLVWVVIMNADQDIAIEGKDLADNMDDERIDGDEWADQIELEDEEEEEAAMAVRDKKDPSSFY